MRKGRSRIIVFDVDGTLIGGEILDWTCFGSAFKAVAGFELDEAFFARVEEVTAQALVHQALAFLDLEERLRMEKLIKEEFLFRLQAAHALEANAFPAIDGVVELLQDLKQQGIPVAIATGDWQESIFFKMTAAGIPFADIPTSTSSDHYCRAEIIAAAVEKAGCRLTDAVYVGDGLWDLRACRALGIPFIGVGRRREKLKEAGALQTLASLQPGEFWKLSRTL